MEKYLSATPIWHEPSEKIAALHEKSIWIRHSEAIISEGILRVSPAPPNSPDRGKVSVAVWGVACSDEPWEPITLRSASPPKAAWTDYWEQFLSPDALDSISPLTPEGPASPTLSLVIPTDR